MNNNWFLWNGVDSRSLGIIVDKYPPLTRPKERMDTVTIPGRQGELYFMEADEPMYETFVMNMDCYLSKAASPGEVARFLSGSGTLVLGCMPDRAYEARIVNKLDYNILLFHRKQMSFTIPFKCQPLRREYPERPIRLSSAGTVTNVSDFKARPIYRLHSGFGVSRYSLTVGGENGTTIVVSMPGGEDEQTAGFTDRVLLIDTDAYIVSNENTGVDLMVNSAIDGDGMDGLFLPIGTTSVSFGGDPSPGPTYVEIMPRWRWYL